ncbi:membrane-spanning protein [Bacillus sp. FJAT-52991]|uniref:Membrane-spanning protein n=1 Tax=Bacillus kandeliae TaxID=3129297 RepID=A0ABZ2N6K5_9BACI
MKKKAIVILSITFAVLMVSAQLNGDSSKWSDTLGRVLIGMLPMLLLFFKRIPFSLPLIVSYYALLFSAFFLGAILRFYDRFSWWDTILHFFGSVFMAFVAVTLYKMFIPEPAERDISSWLIFLFVFTFAVTFSVLWESVEFIGTVMGILESDDNKDTMTDLLSSMAGGLIIAICAVFRKQINDQNLLGNR